MNDIAIDVQGLSKRYRLGGLEPYKTLRESLSNAIHFAFRRLWRSVPISSSEMKDRAANDSDIWALKDVSFVIERGETIGVIGLNGAGKSTLLKVLSRITEPTQGRVTISGRVGSLLEVGTGFHPELTGRENIYLNGAILGMKRSEIARKFDEIVAFADLERFIDTPVKRFSSGMYMRLAFSVAAHLEFEILLVDEVLAVGDMLFQRRCLQKMRDVSHEGRTVVLVSHNMSAIGMLTKSCLWLDAGRVVGYGNTDEIVKRYAENPFFYREGHRDKPKGYADLTGSSCRHGFVKHIEGGVMFRHIRLFNNGIATTDTFYEGETIGVEFGIGVRRAVEVVEVVCRVRRADGYLVFTTFTGKRSVRLEPGEYRISCWFDPNYLRPGWYHLEVSIVSGSSVKQDAVPEAVAFHIIGKVDGDGDPRYAREAMGVIRVDYPWSEFAIRDEAREVGERP